MNEKNSEGKKPKAETTTTYTNVDGLPSAKLAVHLSDVNRPIDISEYVPRLLSGIGVQIRRVASLGHRKLKVCVLPGESADAGEVQADGDLACYIRKAAHHPRKVIHQAVRDALLTMNEGGCVYQFTDEQYGENFSISWAKT